MCHDCALCAATLGLIKVEPVGEKAFFRKRFSLPHGSVHNIEILVDALERPLVVTFSLDRQPLLLLPTVFVAQRRVFDCLEIKGLFRVASLTLRDDRR